MERNNVEKREKRISSLTKKIQSSRVGGDMYCLRRESWCAEDVVEEILLRLSLKPLHRCMSLSKSSRSLISSHYFAHKYRKSRMADGCSDVLVGFHYQVLDWTFPNEIGFIPVSTQGTRSIAQGFDTSRSYFSTIASSAPLRCAGFALVASSNSFLLCKKEEYASDGSCTFIHQDYCVCNPLTGQHKALPKPPDTTLKFEFETFICGGDGYPCLDWVTYKVVLGSDISKLHLKVTIFSSQTWEWVELHLSSTIEFRLLSYDKISPAMSELETVCMASGASRDIDGYFVVFNAKKKTDQLQRVNLPRHEYDALSARLFQCKGRIYTASEYYETIIELWELNEDKWIWDLKYNINAVDIFTGGFQNEPRFLGLDSSNPAVALMELDGMTALVNLKEKSYVLTYLHPNTDCTYAWHSYHGPPCLWLMRTALSQVHRFFRLT